MTEHCHICGDAIPAHADVFLHRERATCGRCFYTVIEAPREKEKDERIRVRNVVPIERTGKLWKACQLAGASLLLVGLVGCLAVVSQDVPDAGARATWQLTSLVGFLLYLTGKIGGWWFHG